jgi:uncharacterized membrane protein (UPF0182 family)
VSDDTHWRPAISVDRPPPRQRRVRIFLLAVLALAVLGGGATLPYYVDALWFESLGYASVFWTRLNLQGCDFRRVRPRHVHGGLWSVLTLKPARLDELIGGTILINGQRLKLVEPVVKLIALGLSLAIAAATGANMMARWTTLALFWHAPRGTTTLDPIFGRPLTFYLFTLPACQLIAGWLLMLAVIACSIATVFVVVTDGARVLTGRRFGAVQTRPWRGLSIAFAALLLMLAARVYLGRFDRLFENHTIFQVLPTPTLTSL